MKAEGWRLCSIGAGRSRRAGGGFGVGSPEEGGGEGQGGRVLGKVVPEEGGTAAQRRQSEWPGLPLAGAGPGIWLASWHKQSSKNKKVKKKSVQSTTKLYIYIYIIYYQPKVNGGRDGS